MSKDHHIRYFQKFMSGVLSVLTVPQVFFDRPKKRNTKAALKLDKGFESDSRNLSRDLTTIYSDFSIARDKILKDAS